MQPRNIRAIEVARENLGRQTSVPVRRNPLCKSVVKDSACCHSLPFVHAEMVTEQVLARASPLGEGFDQDLKPRGMETSRNDKAG